MKFDFWKGNLWSSEYVVDAVCCMFAIDADAWRELFWMNLDEEFSYDCSIVEYVTGSAVEDAGHVE